MEKVLRELIGRLVTKQPSIEERRLAAVAVIIAGDSNPKTLLIKRAEHVRDPWSGQVAFPGGKMGQGDRSAKETAERESREEVGVNLAGDANFAGYSVPFKTHTGDMNVIPAVFLTKSVTEVVPNGEVSGYKWVKLSGFLKPESRSIYRLDVRGVSMSMPAFKMGDYVIWGLTHRIVSSLLGLPLA